MEQNSLKHYGILGMRWGVRRYQNADGTLTAEGKARKAQREHNDTLRYRVGAKRLSNRIGKMEKETRADLASTNPARQRNIESRNALIRETQSVFDSPMRVSSIGTRTIIARTVASLGAATTSGASLYMAAALSSSVPLAGIPISAVALGRYWYKTLS